MENNNEFDIRSINEGAWDSLKHFAAQAGRLEKGGSMWGRGDRSKKAQAQVQTIMSNHANKVIQNLVMMLPKGFPNNKNPKEFVNGSQRYVDAYQSILNYFHMGKLDVVAANELIKNLRVVLKHDLDYKLAMAYQIVKEGADDVITTNNDDSTTIKTLKSNRLPLALAAIGAALGPWKYLAQFDWAKDLIDNGAGTWEDVLENIGAIGNGEGLTQFLQRWSDIPLGPNNSVANLKAAMEKLGDGDMNLGFDRIAPSLAHPEGIERLKEVIAQNPNATMADIFKQNELEMSSGKGGSWFETIKDAKIGKTIENSFTKWLPKKIAALGLEWFGNGVAQGVGLGALASAAILKGARMYGLKHSRAAILQKILSELVLLQPNAQQTNLRTTSSTFSNKQDAEIGQEDPAVSNPNGDDDGDGIPNKLDTMHGDDDDEVNTSNQQPYRGIGGNQQAQSQSQDAAKQTAINGIQSNGSDNTINAQGANFVGDNNSGTIVGSNNTGTVIGANNSGNITLNQQIFIISKKMEELKQLVDAGIITKEKAAEIHKTAVAVKEQVKVAKNKKGTPQAEEKEEAAIEMLDVLGDEVDAAKKEATGEPTEVEKQVQASVGTPTAQVQPTATTQTAQASPSADVSESMNEIIAEISPTIEQHVKDIHKNDMSKLPMAKNDFFDTIKELAEDGATDEAAIVDALQGYTSNTPQRKVWLANKEAFINLVNLVASGEELPYTKVNPSAPSLEITNPENVEGGTPDGSENPISQIAKSKSHDDFSAEEEAHIEETIGRLIDVENTLSTLPLTEDDKKKIADIQAKVSSLVDNTPFQEYWDALVEAEIELEDLIEAVEARGEGEVEEEQESVEQLTTSVDGTPENAARVEKFTNIVNQMLSDEKVAKGARINPALKSFKEATRNTPREIVQELAKLYAKLSLVGKDPELSALHKSASEVRNFILKYGQSWKNFTLARINNSVDAFLAKAAKEYRNTPELLQKVKDYGLQPKELAPTTKQVKSVDNGKPYAENPKNVNSLAKKMISGAELSDDDRKLQANFPSELEASLEKIKNGASKAASTKGRLEAAVAPITKYVPAPYKVVVRTTNQKIQPDGTQKMQKTFRVPIAYRIPKKIAAGIELSPTDIAFSKTYPNEFELAKNIPTDKQFTLDFSDETACRYYTMFLSLDSMLEHAQLTDDQRQEATANRDLLMQVLLGQVSEQELSNRGVIGANPNDLNPKGKTGKGRDGQLKVVDPNAPVAAPKTPKVTKVKTDAPTVAGGAPVAPTVSAGTPTAKVKTAAPKAATVKTAAPKVTGGAPVAPTVSAGTPTASEKPIEVINVDDEGYSTNDPNAGANASLTLDSIRNLDAMKTGRKEIINKLDSRLLNVVNREGSTLEDLEAEYNTGVEFITSISIENPKLKGGHLIARPDAARKEYELAYNNAKAALKAKLKGKKLTPAPEKPEAEVKKPARTNMVKVKTDAALEKLKAAEDRETFEAAKAEYLSLIPSRDTAQATAKAIVAKIEDNLNALLGTENDGGLELDASGDGEKPAAPEPVVGGGDGEKPIPLTKKQQTALNKVINAKDSKSFQEAKTKLLEILPNPSPATLDVIAKKEDLFAKQGSLNLDTVDSTFKPTEVSGGGEGSVDYPEGASDALKAAIDASKTANIEGLGELAGGLSKADRILFRPYMEKRTDQIDAEEEAAKGKGVVDNNASLPSRSNENKTDLNRLPEKVDINPAELSEEAKVAHNSLPDNMKGRVRDIVKIRRFMSEDGTKNLHLKAITPIGQILKKIEKDDKPLDELKQIKEMVKDAASLLINATELNDVSSEASAYYKAKMRQVLSSDDLTVEPNADVPKQVEIRLNESNTQSDDSVRRTFGQLRQDMLAHFEAEMERIIAEVASDEKKKVKGTYKTTTKDGAEANYEDGVTLLPSKFTSEHRKEVRSLTKQVLALYRDAWVSHLKQVEAKPLHAYITDTLKISKEKKLIKAKSKGSSEEKAA
jgi:hypothetical protein